MKDIVIYQARIAKQLLNLGFNIKNISAHNSDKKMTVFYFEDSPEIREVLINNFNMKF